MDKFPKIRYPGDDETDGLLDGDVVVLEKLDGANFRFTFDDDGNIVCGSRNVTFTENGEPLPLDEINTAFRHAIEYLRETIPQSVRENEHLQQYVYYGEAMHRHSIVYDDIEYEQPEKGAPYPGGDVPNVVLFDAKLRGEWVEWDHVVDVTDELNMQHAKVHDRGDPEDCSFEIPEESMFGGSPEGIVVRRMDGSVRAKKVTDDFKEKNAVAFEDPSKAQTDATAFVAAYVTESRIEKMAHKLVDEGEWDGLQMEMMEDLPREVLRDAIEENAWELITNDGYEGAWDEDFKYEIRSKASKKCARVLKEELQSL